MLKEHRQIPKQSEFMAFFMQKKNSGTFAQTQRESLPDITVQV